MFGFVSGFLAPFRGAARLMVRPRLQRLAAAPIVINVALCAATAWAFFGWLEPAIEGRFFAAAADGGFWNEAGRWAVRLLAFVASLPLLLGVYLVLAGVVGGPFYEALCAAVEAEVLGTPEIPPPRSVVAAIFGGLRVEAGNLLVTLIGGLLALVLTFAVPVAGVFLATAIGWFLAGFGYLAYPFDRRTLTLREKLGVVLRRFDVALGFGCATYLLMMPIVTAPLVAPCAVAGAALLFPGARRASARPA